LNPSLPTCHRFTVYGTEIVLAADPAGELDCQPGEVMIQTRRETNEKTQITKLAENLRSELIVTRRDFHMRPELSGQEQRTAGIVADKLREYGLKVSTGVGGHGVIGLLEGKRDGPIVAWRADMDAVPGDEILDAPCKSCVPGVIHICGHDAHTTVGLGIAQVLSFMRDQVAGRSSSSFNRRRRPW
jgi:metal-dependent amidase/aminoacylase/carboxypeptidase family protein